MTILITGAAGFIGAHLAREMVIRGEKIIALDNFSSYYSQDLKRKRCEALLSSVDVEILNLNISDMRMAAQIFDRFEIGSVIHLAAQPGVRLPISRYGDYVEANLVGFSNIAQLVANHGIDRFLYASSSSVYGNSTSETFLESDTAIRPLSFYGATKMSNEILAGAISSTARVRTRGLRFFTAYGPWGRPDMAYFRLIALRDQPEKFQLFGDGSMKRDFTYIDDIVQTSIELFDQLARQSSGSADVVNVGGGNPRAMEDLLGIVLGQKNLARVTRLPEDTADVTRTVADTTYLKSLVGDSPKISLEEGIEKIMEWASNSAVSGRLTEWIQSV